MGERRQRIACSWCGRPVVPNGPRMRMHQSATAVFSGPTLAHFHPECGDAVLDACEAHLAANPPPAAVTQGVVDA